ncbi:MAG: DUF4169 family protein [Emcibacteraceae bacterium]|nr:DUF4169 family protein [Emcibacteraceae bacterium]MDG1996237.1 DUF4169 family protein [Emcibacteraceae bacterium]
MSEILSFSKAKKKKARVEKEKQANENRAKFGRTRFQKKLDKAKAENHINLVDDHKLDD